MSNASELSMFGDIYDVDMSAMQMESIASDLVFLLKHSGLSRSELASRLGWNKSRVTRILSGDENLTIKTITSVAECLGYGFDVIFYNENYEQPKQPWHIDRINKSVSAEPVHTKSPFEFKFQSSKDVFNDLMKGDDADAYISISKVFDIKKIESLQNPKNISHTKDTFFWEIPGSKDSFILDSEKKDKEQWMTI